MFGFNTVYPICFAMQVMRYFDVGWITEDQDFIDQEEIKYLIFGSIFFSQGTFGKVCCLLFKNVSFCVVWNEIQ